MTNGKQFNLGGLMLDLRLNGKAILNIEKRLGTSIMSLYMGGNGGVVLPATNKLLIVLQGANQIHGITDKDMIGGFEKYLEAGNTPMDLNNVIQELLDEAGFFGKKKDDTKTDGESTEMTLDGEPTEVTNPEETL
ncbi:DUF6096 family protein [Latilactobacillus curvatus]|uniref:DUF6096 family protein n=1 Tax=Latilactobacillus curvatus TaxID=28038 RepID=UPI0024DF75D4|nr:DUF6096 family protein [Latilactobacillus curvatus]WIE01538.1 DUF6096 family protein [Latilactobacillus curvatus]